MALNKKDRERVSETIEAEGFLYAFEDYCDFEEVKDEEFHRLRTAFLESLKNLREYIE